MSDPAAPKPVDVDHSRHLGRLEVAVWMYLKRGRQKERDALVETLNAGWPEQVHPAQLGHPGEAELLAELRQILAELQSEDFDVDVTIGRIRNLIARAEGR